MRRIHIILNRRNWQPCVLLMNYLDLSYRDMKEWLLATDKVYQTLDLPRIPDHTTLQRTWVRLADAGFDAQQLGPSDIIPPIRRHGKLIHPERKVRLQKREPIVKAMVYNIHR